MTVLIVDDSAVMRKVIGRTLSQAGLETTEVLEAGNGLEALMLLRARTADHPTVELILSDINMAVMGGFEFVERLRAESLMGNVPVVMISSEASESQVRRALATGASGYIRKPFTADQIKATVTRLVTTL
jgi:two-component system chemotaxis response regulator CheY